MKYKPKNTDSETVHNFLTELYNSFYDKSNKCYNIQMIMKNLAKICTALDLFKTIENCNEIFKKGSEGSAEQIIQLLFTMYNNLHTQD